MTTLAVLVPLRPGTPPPPEALPMGRAALHLREEGIRVVFGAEVAPGARLTGWEPQPGRWAPVADVAVDAAYDRYPNRDHPDAHAAMREALSGVIFANSWACTLVCRDKIATQQALEAAGLPMPDIVVDPTAFADALAAWDTGFLKPRYGACGRGVRRVLPGDALPTEVEGARAGVPEPAFLQRAVPPPEGWAGVSVRINIQREGTDWVANEAVARRSRHDFVVNAGRGAEVRPGRDVLSETTLAALEANALRAARTLGALEDGQWLIEVGVDAMIAADGRPILIEVNSRPYGRVEALAALDPDRFGGAHLEACLRPLRYLASALG